KEYVPLNCIPPAKDSVWLRSLIAGSEEEHFIIPCTGKTKRGYNATCVCFAQEDIDLMAKMNFDAYLFSISWSRIFPRITPYPNLNHYDLPQALQDRYNGWLGRGVKRFFRLRRVLFQNIWGQRQTFNEPRVVAALGYDNGFFALGRCSKAFGNSLREIQPLSLISLPIISFYVMQPLLRDIVTNI
ncbi:beta-glucosidase, partial [Striga asiatica]